jgi:23S rRNA (adenine2503-C2)-methyltransferase
MPETSLVKSNLLGMDRTRLVAFFQSLEEPAFRAQQLLKWIHTLGILDFAQMTNLSKALREKLTATAQLTTLQINSHQVSKDGTQKWLFDLPDKGAIETVWIPEANRATLCISSQAGCALNCRFCHTGYQGFQRHLSASEIIAQVWIVYHSLKQQGIETRDGRPITNIVFMGMGEPLLNLSEVLPAIKILRDDLAYGFSKWRVTVSTSGVVPGIKTLVAETDVALALSLHAPTDELRTTIIPLNKKYPIAQVLAACQTYTQLDKRRKVTIEYVMLRGINDQPHHAKELVKVLAGLPNKVNLIPFNPFPQAPYQCSEPLVIAQFQEILVKAGLLTTVRRTRGQDIEAACGQLAGEISDKTQRSAKWQQTIRTIQPAPEQITQL